MQTVVTALCGRVPLTNPHTTLQHFARNTARRCRMDYSHDQSAQLLRCRVFLEARASAMEVQRVERLCYTLRCRTHEQYPMHVYKRGKIPSNE